MSEVELAKNFHLTPKALAASIENGTSPCESFRKYGDAFCQCAVCDVIFASNIGAQNLLSNEAMRKAVHVRRS